MIHANILEKEPQLTKSRNAGYPQCILSSGSVLATTMIEPEPNQALPVTETCTDPTNVRERSPQF